jgi:UPF0176 protein
MDAPQPVTIATLYHLVPLAECAALQAPWKAHMVAHGVLGTLLVTPEGLNGTIAGAAAGVQAVLNHLKSHPQLAELTWKTSFAATNPFARAKVKLKREVIPLGHPVQPHMAGQYVKPEHWNALISQPDVFVVDTRNAYEIPLGQFVGAHNPHTRTFRDLPAWLNDNLPEDRTTPVAMYCTGGIRCEKSTAYVRALGYANVYHLQGGILQYLEDVPAHQSLWEGDCYVFDDRVAVNHQLQPAGTYSICTHCGGPVNAADWRRNSQAPCPHCRPTKGAAAPTASV